MSKISRVLPFLLALTLLPSCLVVGVGRPADLDKDLSPETLQFYRSVEAQPKGGDLGGTFFTLFPLILSVSNIHSLSAEPEKKEGPGYGGVEVGMHLLGIAALTSRATYYSSEGKIRSKHRDRRFLTGLLYRDWLSEKEAREGAPAAKTRGWSVLWGFFGREVKDGQSDWTFFWLL